MISHRILGAPLIKFKIKFSSREEIEGFGLTCFKSKFSIGRQSIGYEFGNLILIYDVDSFKTYFATTKKLSSDD